MSFGLFGPRRNEIRRFFVGNRDKLPSELRDVLGNLLWTEALLTNEPSKSGELASDNPAIIELVTQLVDAAHRPKDTDQIQKFHRLADECSSTPGLVAALRQEFTHDRLEHKIQVRGCHFTRKSRMRPGHNNSCRSAGRAVDAVKQSVIGRVSTHTPRLPLITHDLLEAWAEQLAGAIKDLSAG